jgi:hypothetical protein
LGDKAFDWVQRFDGQARAQVLNNPGDTVRLREHADYAADESNI